MSKVNNVEQKRVDLNKFAPLAGVKQLVDAVKDGFELDMQHTPQSRGNNIICFLVKSVPTVDADVFNDALGKLKDEGLVENDTPELKKPTTTKSSRSKTVKQVDGE